MIDAQEFAALAQLPESLLTAYINTNPGLPTNCRAIPGYTAWLKTEAKHLLAATGHMKGSVLHRQVERIAEYLDAHRPAHKGVMILAGPDVWQVIPLPTEPHNELHWGRPHLWQLLTIMERQTPVCVVALDLAGVRMYKYVAGSLSQSGEWHFKVETSHWRQKERAHMAKQGTRMPHGAQREAFDRRIEAEYVRLMHDVAKGIEAFCERESIDRVYLLGSDRLTRHVQDALPQRLRDSLVCIPRIPRGNTEDPASEIKARVESHLHAYESDRKAKIVEELLNRPRGIVTGLDHTLNALQRGLLTSLTVVESADPKLYECKDCGLVTASAGSRCPTCNGLRRPTSLQAVLPTLLTRHMCRLEIVTDRAATRLKSVDGIGGRLRMLKRQPAPVYRSAAAERAPRVARRA